MHNSAVLEMAERQPRVIIHMNDIDAEYMHAIQDS